MAPNEQRELRPADRMKTRAQLFADWQLRVMRAATNARSPLPKKGALTETEIRRSQATPRAYGWAEGMSINIHPYKEDSDFDRADDNKPK
jgi:hypothetical protein